MWTCTQVRWREASKSGRGPTNIRTVPKELVFEKARPKKARQIKLNRKKLKKEA